MASSPLRALRLGGMHSSQQVVRGVHRRRAHLCDVHRTRELQHLHHKCAAGMRPACHLLIFQNRSHERHGLPADRLVRLEVLCLENHLCGNSKGLILSDAHRQGQPNASARCARCRFYKCDTQEVCPSTTRTGGAACARAVQARCRVHPASNPCPNHRMHGAAAHASPERVQQHLTIPTGRAGQFGGAAARRETSRHGPSDPKLAGAHLHLLGALLHQQQGGAHRVQVAATAHQQPREVNVNAVENLSN